MDIVKMNERLREYCAGRRCTECVLCTTAGCGWNEYSESCVRECYDRLVRIGHISDKPCVNPVNEAHIAEQTEADTVKIGEGDYIGYVSFDFGWIKGDFPLEGDSDDLLGRLKIVSQIIAAEAESLKRFVDDLE